MKMIHENLFLVHYHFTEENRINLLFCCTRNVRIELSEKSVYQIYRVLLPSSFSPLRQYYLSLLLNLLWYQIHTLAMLSALNDAAISVM